ncbi:MAG: response regulator [Acidobacteriota bacterium]
MSSSAPSKLQKLREAFIKQLPNQLAAIRIRFDALDKDNPSPKDLEDFHRAVHTIKGSSAAFGLKELSATAEVGELLAKEAVAGRVDAMPEWREMMAAHLHSMSQAIERVDCGCDMGFVTLDVAAAETIHSGADRKVVYLCEDDPLQLSSLVTQIGCFGFEVHPYADLEGFYAAVRKREPDVIVMDMVHPEDRSGGAQVVNRVRTEQGRKTPVVYISSESGIEARLAAVRAGCDAYFVKPVDPNALSTVLHSLTGNEQPDPYRIMIVDDDVHLSGMYEAVLQEAGMVTLAVNDPMLALDRLAGYKPDLILMDMHMPQCNGMELAGVIRQITEYDSIPIVFLSTESDQDVHVGARRMGGDEFLLKSITGQALVSTVAARAQRMRHLRSYMLRDSLTGLYNHSSTKDQLETAVCCAQRNGENACFVMIDLDHFKSVNDRYGHSAGDRVLVALANLLKQRLRKSDVIGRYGGEEFAVILPRTAMPEAVALMNSLRACFESIQFPMEGGFFNVSFSCGVAALSSHDSAEKLSLAADQALYRAKKEGRNRVVAANRFLTAAQIRDLTVLVVEDAHPIRAILVSMLESVGFTKIIPATQGQEALDILHSRKIDLILADWHMPVMNGMELLRAVRSEDSLCQLPFVMITGESDKNSVQEAILAGVSEYVLKPVFSEELFKKIVRALFKQGNQA